MLYLDQRGVRVFFEPKCRAIPQFTTGIEPGVEQMPGHDVPEGFQHRLLDPGMLPLEIEDLPSTGQ